MSVQSVVFSKRLWTILQAADWLRKHGHANYFEPDIKENTIRFRQLEPRHDKRYATIDLGSSGIQYVMMYPKIEKRVRFK